MEANESLCVRQTDFDLLLVSVGRFVICCDIYAREQSESQFEGSNLKATDEPEEEVARV